MYLKLNGGRIVYILYANKSKKKKERKENQKGFFSRVNVFLVFLRNSAATLSRTQFDVQTVNACMHLDTGTDLDFPSQETRAFWEPWALSNKAVNSI